MEPEVVARARERAQDLISWIEDSIADLADRKGAAAHGRAQELSTWLHATLATAKRELAPRPADQSAPTSVLKDVAFIVDLLAHDRPGEVALEVSARATPFVRGDRWTVRRLLLDVLLDARAAEPRGGKLRIEVEADADHAIVRVVNGGPTVRPIDLAHTPTPRSLERHANLIKAARLLGTLGGGLAVEGELGCGMTVTIRLPLLASRPLPATAARSSSVPRESAWPKNEPTSPCA